MGNIGYGMIFIIFVITVLLAWLVLWGLKKIRLFKLKKEEKDLFYKAIEKIKKIDLANKMFVTIGILLYIIISIIKGNVFPTQWQGPMGLTSFNPMQEVANVALYYIVIYYIVRIFFRNFYVKKRIEKNEQLSENEILLLKKYYIESIGTYICKIIILENIALFLHLAFTAAQ